MDLINFIFETLNTIKLYHWSTHKYAAHKATDNLYKYLDTTYDSMMETYFKDSVIAFSPTQQSVVVDVLDESTFVDFLKSMIMFLNSNKDINERDELKNIRDEIVANINKTMYLLRLA